MEEETGIWANPVYGCITSKATARIENILKEYEVSFSCIRIFRLQGINLFKPFMSHILIDP